MLLKGLIFQPPIVFAMKAKKLKKKTILDNHFGFTYKTCAINRFLVYAEIIWSDLFVIPCNYFKEVHY